MTVQKSTVRQVRRRRFANPDHQHLYDVLRADPPEDLAAVRGQGLAMNTYAIGRSMPAEPPRLAPRGSRAYAAWAAGVDNAREAEGA